MEKDTKLIIIILAFLLLMSLIFCGFNYLSDLHVPVEIPESNLKAVTGYFKEGSMMLDNHIRGEAAYYQFRSHDDTVCWLLTEEEIGCVPNPEFEYVLVFFDNGTTKRNDNCDCAPEMDCECYLYDDVFLCIKEA